MKKKKKPTISRRRIRGDKTERPRESPDMASEPSSPVSPVAPPEAAGSVSLAEANAPALARPSDEAVAEVQPEQGGGLEPRLPLRDLIALRSGTADCLLFRVAREYFAVDLAAVEEAIELPEVHHLPEMPDILLGVFELRGRLLPVYSPSQVLRVQLASGTAAVIVLRAKEKRMGLAIDDVEDVLVLDLSRVRRPPVPDNDDNVLLGVGRHGDHLVTIVDAEALVAACLSDQLTEAV